MRTQQIPSGNLTYTWKTYGCVCQNLTIPHRSWWSLLAVNQHSSSECALFWPILPIPTLMWAFHQLNTALTKIACGLGRLALKILSHPATSHPVDGCEIPHHKDDWRPVYIMFTSYWCRTSTIRSSQGVPPSGLSLPTHGHCLAWRSDGQVAATSEAQNPASSLLMMPLCPRTGGRTTLPVSLCRRCTQTAWGYPARKAQELRSWHFGGSKCVEQLGMRRIAGLLTDVFQTFVLYYSGARSTYDLVPSKSTAPKCRRSHRADRSFHTQSYTEEDQVFFC